MTDEVGKWVTGILTVLAVGYLLRNAYRWIRASAMTISDRLWILPGSPILLMMLVLLVTAAFNIPSADISWVWAIAGWSIVILGIASLIACIEWVQKYLLLKRFGRTVPRKGFRWWAMLAWIVSGVVLNSAWPLLIRLGHQMDPAPYSASGSLLSLLIGLWTLALFSGFVVTALYVRRTARAYETLRLQLPPPHPGLSEADAN